jgi:cell division septation protein DedD
MRKKTKKKRRHPKQSSLVKNLALLFLSLGLLAGASFVFSYFGNRSELSLDPIQSTWDSLFSHEEKLKPPPEQPKPKASSVSPSELSFYDILEKKGPSAPTEESYTIQIGAFKSKDQAKTFAKELKEKNKLSFRIDKAGKLNCVRWGTFTTQEKAEKTCEKLSAKLHRECKVVKM